MTTGPLVSLHVPKTGGTSLNSVIAARLLMKFVPAFVTMVHVDSLTLPDGRVESRYGDRIVVVPSPLADSLRYLPFFAAHINIEIAKLLSPKAVFVVLRDPRLRLSSHFLHEVRMGSVPVDWTIVDWLLQKTEDTTAAIGRLGEPLWRGRKHYQGIFQQLMPATLAGHELLLEDSYLSGQPSHLRQLAHAALSEIDYVFYPTNAYEVLDHLCREGLIPKGMGQSDYEALNVTPEEIVGVPRADLAEAMRVLSDASVLDIELIRVAREFRPQQHMNGELVTDSQLSDYLVRRGLAK